MIIKNQASFLKCGERLWWHAQASVLTVHLLHPGPTVATLVSSQWRCTDFRGRFVGTSVQLPFPTELLRGGTISGYFPWRSTMPRPDSYH